MYSTALIGTFIRCCCGSAYAVDLSRATNNGRGNNEVFAQVSKLGLHVTSMRTKTNRLEELFIRLVENKDERRSA